MSVHLMPLRLTPDDDLDLENDELLPERLLSGFELEALVRTLKRQQETAVRQIDNGGSNSAKVYEVQERWAATHLKNDNTIKVIDDSFSLELAMRDPEVKTILIPRDHTMEMEIVKRFCARAPKYKSIFIDVSR